MQEEQILGGFIILSKLIYQSPIWLDDPHVLKLFVYLIGQARYKHEPKKYPLVTIKRGEIVTSLDHISRENEYSENNMVKHWSKSRVSRMLHKLDDQGYISLACDTYGTHIKVCNYERYQNIKLYACDGCGTAAEHLREQLKKDKKDNIFIEKSEPEKTRKKTTPAEFKKILEDLSS